MADRKLYHLVNGEFVLNGMPSVHVPTYEEVDTHIAILRNVGFFDDRIAESVPAWDGLSNGKRTTEKQASLYDAMLAEIYAEHDGEKAKVRNRRKADRKHPENKAERKKEKQNRMHRLYGLAYEDTKYGKTVYFWGKKEGQKKFPEYEAEIFRNLKERSAEKSARAEEPAEYRVGWSKIDRMMYHADKIMREIRANIAEIPGAETHDEYWKDMNGEILFYEDEYYYRKAEWDYCYHKKIKGQKPDYADMCAMWEQIANAELNEWLKYA